MATTVITETVYINRDNSIDLILSSEVNGVKTVTDLTAVTRVDVVATNNKFTVTSVGHPSWISWGTVNGKLTLTLGAAGIPKGKYEAQIILFDPAHPNGLVWTVIDLEVEPVHPPV
jgi:hypothetical protein